MTSHLNFQTSPFRLYLRSSSLASIRLDAEAFLHFYISVGKARSLSCFVFPLPPRGFDKFKRPFPVWSWRILHSTRTRCHCLAGDAEKPVWRPSSAMAWQRFWVSRFSIATLQAKIASREANPSIRSRRQILLWRKNLHHSNGSERRRLLGVPSSIGDTACSPSLTGLVVTMGHGLWQISSLVSLPYPKYLDLSWIDINSGITVGAVVVPQSMAYAKLAELPVQFGLYSSFMGVLIYWFFATSKDITIGVCAQ